MADKLTEYVLKHSKRRDKELKYDFMPSLLEIIERPAHKAGTVIIFGVFSLLVLVVVWASLSKIDVVVTASGSVQPIGDINIVQAKTSGTVSAIHVSEGDYVQAGDVLVELNTELLDIDIEQMEKEQEILEAQKAIYSTLSQGTEADIKISAYKDRLQPYVQLILDAHTSYKNSLDGLEKDKLSADLNRQIAQLQMEQYEEQGIESEVKRLELLAQQYSISVEQIDLNISETKTQYDMQLNQQLVQIEAKLNEIKVALEKYEISKLNQQITAPVSGHVNSIAVTNSGAPVSAMQELVTIVPDNSSMEMVCYISNKDIADIEVGMETEIKLEAYPYNKYGTVKGVVSYISPSTYSSQTQGNVYLVCMNISQNNERIKLMSGLTGSVEIKIGKRTVLSYFMDPIMKGFDESLKEK